MALNIATGQESSFGRRATARDIDALIELTYTYPTFDYDLEIFSVTTRPPMNRTDIEDRVRRSVERDVRNGSLPKEIAEEVIRLNIETIVKQQSQPVLAHERYRVSGNRIRRDWTTSLDGIDVSPDTEFRHTQVLMGDHRRGTRTMYALDHALKSGVFNPHQPSRTITSPWGQLVGLHDRLRRVIVMATAHFPKVAPGETPPSNEQLQPDPQRVEAFARGTETARWYVESTSAEEGERLIYRYVDSGRVITTIVLDPKNPWHVYEQTIADKDGLVSLNSISVAFEDTYVPREKVIMEIKDGIGEILRKFIVLRHEVPARLEKGIFDFQPPDGYVIQQIGSDGIGIVEPRDRGEVRRSPTWSSIRTWIIRLNLLALIAFVLIWWVRKCNRRGQYGKGQAI